LGGNTIESQLEIEMDAFIKIVDALAWPLTILIIVFYFRRFLKEFLQIVTSRLTKARAITAKMGAFELNVHQIEELQKRVEQIAKEPDAEKRLRMARDPLLVDDLLKRITPEEVKVLETFYKQRLRDAFIVNWYEVPEKERSILMNLEKEGVIRGYEAYGDSIEWLTPLGVALLKKLGTYENHEDQTSQ